MASKQEPIQSSKRKFHGSYRQQIATHTTYNIIEFLHHLQQQPTIPPLQGKHLVAKVFMELPRQIYHFSAYCGG